jgi:radical SAM superfamily enzyme
MSIVYEKYNLYPESILIRRFIGKVSIEDIINSWEYLNKNKLINDKIKGVINNLSCCELIFDMENFNDLLNYLNKHDYIKKIKLAVISDSPKTIIFPFIGEEQERELKIKPFSTTEAAVNWILM